LSQNYKVQLYESVRASPTAVDAVWDCYLDMTAVISARLMKQRKNVESFPFEIISASWSSYLPQQKASLIAIGLKSGLLSLWTYVYPSVELLVTLQLQPAWITHLDWAPQGPCLVIAQSSGTVTVLRIKFSQSDSSVYTEPIGSPFAEDYRKVSCLKWISSNIILIAKSNSLCIWDLETNTLRDVKLPMSSMVTSMVLTADDASVRLFTLDGQIFVITLRGEFDSHETISTKRAFFAKHNSIPADHSQVNTLTPNKSEIGAHSKVSNELEDGEDENGEDGDDETGDAVPSFNRKQPRFHGACRSTNGVYNAVLYTIFPVNELYYRTSKVDNSYLDFLCVNTLGEDDIEEVALERLLYSLQPQSNDLPAVLPLPGTKSLLWDLLSLSEMELMRGISLHSSFFNRFMGYLEHWVSESSSSQPIGHDMISRLRHYNPYRWFYMLELFSQGKPSFPPNIRNGSNFKRIRSQLYCVFLEEVFIECHRRLKKIHVGVFLKNKSDWEIMERLCLALGAFITDGSAAFAGGAIRSLRNLFKLLIETMANNATPEGGPYSIAKVFEWDTWIDKLTSDPVPLSENLLLKTDNCPACSMLVRVTCCEGNIGAVCEKNHIWSTWHDSPK
jgi:hypothetical protein